MEERGIGGLSLYPSLLILLLFFESFTEAERQIGRERELAADLAGAEVTSNDDAAAALVKVHAFDRSWRRAMALLREAIAHARPNPNLGTLYVQAAVENAGSVWTRKDLDEEQPSHPTDSHPPLSASLRVVKQTLEDVAARALQVPPDISAITLFNEPETIEQELTKLEKIRLIESYMVREGSALK